MLLVAGVVGIVLPVVAGAAPAAAAAGTFVVNDLTDRSSASCEAASTTCTLRAAVAAGNALPGGGAVILLPAGTHSTAGGRAGDTGDIDVLAPMTILGPGRSPGSAAATITGAGDRVLEVDAPGVVVAGVVVTGGSARSGAGVSITARGDLTLTRSTVSGNVAADDGGAIANAGRLSLEASTLAGNTAVRRGGALSNAGTATLVNSTVHGNTANAGGGIISTGAADLLHVTISGNSSTNRLGGGLQRQGGTVSMRASIIAANNANSGDAKDCSGSPFLDGLNLIGNPAGCNPTGFAPITGAAGLAADLADNGGPTPTRALLPTSPALDRITAPCAAPVDQRGVARPGGGGCDLGAYELEVLGVDLTLSTDVTDTGAGASSVPLAALRDAATAPPAAAGDPPGTDVRSATLRSITLRSITLRSITLRSITLRSITLRSITLRSITLRSIDAAATTLRSITLRSITLRSILLSDVEVPGGWEALLAGTAFADVPLQHLTLEDVIDLPQVASLTLDDVDLSATRIGSLSLATLLLGTTTLRSIPLDPALLAAAGGDVLVAWCQLLGAGRCADLGLDPSDPATFDGVSLLTLDLAGVDLEGIGLASIHLTDLDLAATTLRSIPISELEPGSVGDIVDCALVSCATATLGDAEAAGALRGTLADLVLAFVGDADLGWEDVDLEGGELQPIADPIEPTFTSSLGLDLRGGAPADVDVVITLPAGFALDRGTSTLDGATAADPAVDGRTLRFSLDDLPAGHHVITFDAWAGLRLGSATTTAQATATAASGTARSAVVSDAVDVDEAFEGGAAADTGHREIGDDRLHIAHLSRPGDVDLYRFQVTDDDARRGATATIRLANLPADYDLALYGPPSEPLRGAPTEERDLLPDHLLDTGSADDALTAEPTADVPQVLPFAAPEVVHRISARRSAAAEQIDTGSLRAGTYWVQVSGANGTFDDDPYSLRIRLDAGIDRGPCAALPFTFPLPPAAPVSTPTGIDTVFLVNRQRLAAAFGPAAAPSLTALDQFAARTDLGFRGAVVNVDGSGPVRDSYASWDSDRCSPDAANGVVGAIGGLLDAVRAANPDLANVVLVGDDLQIPFARVPDGVALSNEQSFADELAGHNELVAALARGYVLTDNAYGATAGIAVNDHELFVPELAVGRLVETPDEITGALTRYAAAGGVLDVRSALVTGYDFLADGAEAVAAALGEGTERLIDQPGADQLWDREQLVAALAGLDAPAVASINAHFDHTRALPSLGNSTGDETDLFTTADIAGPVATALGDALLFSMGCHSGLSVADVTVGAVVPDWAQTFAGVAGGWVGNTGFGYGDTELVALSEDLMARFAGRLAAGEPAGEALAAAKQDYASAVALVGPYDEKVLHQATLYGLPMLRLGEPVAAGLAATATAPPPEDPPITIDLHTGLPATTRAIGFDVATNAADRGPATLTPASTEGGDYYHVDGDTLNQAHRPVEPRTSYDLTRADGAQPSGALVTSLTSVDVPGFEPLFFSPTVDQGAHEPRAVAADATFPARFVDVTSTPRPGPDEQRLVVVPGQFRASTTAGLGTQRLFTDIGTLVYHGDPAAGGPPIGVRQTVAATTGGTARFQVDLDGTAVRVYVLYKQRGLDTAGATWTGIDLLREPGTDRWFGQGPGTDPVEYIVQAVGPDGQVYWATSKGTDFGSVPGGTPPGLQVDVDGPAPVGGWHPGAVTVTATGVGVTYSLDGAPFQPYTGPIEISTDGLHTILFRDANGTTETRIVRVDATGPMAAATTDPAGAWSAGPTVVTITAADGAGSGVASITYRIGGSAATTVNASSAVVEVATEGETTIHFRSTDAAGNVGPESSITVRIDTVRPVVACGSASTAWLSGNASIPCTAFDPGAGLANPADASFNLVTTVPVGTETAAATTGSRQVCDNAGNCSTAGPVGGNLVDRKGPAITITSPVDGALVGVGALLTAAYTCAEGGSGVASCTAAVGTTPVASGGTLPAGTRGTYTLVVTGRDNVGNVSTASATYVVGYGICLQYDPTKPTSIGAAVPIRLQLCDGTRNVSSASIVVEAFSIDGGPPPPPNFQGSSNLGNRFRLDGASKTYIYNLDTTGLSPGPHVMHLRVGGAVGSGYVAPFTLTL